jgi:hypothetical protein
MFVKRFFQIFLFLLILLLAIPALSQRFLGAFSVGMNLTQVDGDEEYGFNKVGLNIGPSVILPFGKDKKWSITMELLFSQMGSRQKSVYAARDSITDSLHTGYYDGYRLSLNYLQIPLMVHFTDKRIIAAGVGFAYGQLVGVSEYEDYNDPRGWVHTATSLNSGTYAKSDYEVLADVRLRLWKKLWVNVRYSYSMVPIRTRVFVNPLTSETWTRKQYNNVITLRLVYIFNDLLPNKKKKRGTDEE